MAKRFARARWPEATGPWLLPDQETPGTTNHVALHHEIVINEIMYHARDLPAIPALYFTNTLLTITNQWRYDQSGADLGTEWTAPDYDDSLWSMGQAVFFTNISTLPAPKGTTLSLSNSLQRGITTYYFREPFVFTNSTGGVQLSLNPIIDDGAIFYLNGVEVYRYAMPDGAVTYTTRANVNTGIPTYSGPVNIPVDNLIVGTNIFAVEVHQYLPPPGSKDVAFAAELVASGFVSAPVPPRASPESWLELFNRGTNAVDLTGWQFTDGIEYQFAAGTTMAHRGYLVVAKDVDYFRSIHPDITVVGPFTNNLSGGSDHLLLTDAIGNPADEVRYFDGKPWPGYADGLVSSLELRDPHADNAKAEAWAASDESAPSQWKTYSYRGVAATEPAASPTQWNEFVMGLLGEGEVLLDDLSVIESPNGIRRQLLQNGSFETGLNAWRALGTQRHSEVIVDPDNPGNHVLRLVADGDTEHMHNHLETTLANSATIVNGTEYEISFRARWLAGCNKLNTRLYFNRLARTTLLDAPTANGTPGARNSTYTPNIGPTFAHLTHTPVVPVPSEPVTISIDAADPEGVAAMNLFYAVNGGTWRSLAMTSSVAGLTQSAFATVPGQPADSLVQFYVSATDGLGAVATYPSGGTNSRALYKVSGDAAIMPHLHTLQILMTSSDATLMHQPTNVMSNEQLGCTVVYDRREVFYDASVHLQSSERGRDVTSRVGFTVTLPADHLFRGVQDSFTVDRSGGQSGKGGRHDEILLKHAINKAGGLPGMYDDLVQFFAPRSAEDSTGLLIMAKYGNVFLDSQYPNGGAGESYKLELIYYPTTTATGDPQAPKLPEPDGVLDTDIKNLGDDPEAYRWTFIKENHVANSNYQPIMGLAKAFSLTGTDLATQLGQYVNVDEWLRAVAFLSLIGGDDMYTYGHSHNLIIYFPPDDPRGMAFPWDMDYSFVAAVNKAFPGNGSANTYKIITSIPDNYRRYYNHLLELSNITGDSDYMGQWASRYAGLLGQNWNGVVDYLAQRAAFVRSVMPLTTPFAIASNGGSNFATTNDSVTLTGSAPLTVKDIAVNGITLPVTWTSLTDWTVNVPLPAPDNVLFVQGIDNYSHSLTNANASITVTNLGQVALMPVVINEWMASNAGPGGFPDPADGLFQDWFELYNPNDTAVDLAGYYLTDTLLQPAQFTIPANTTIEPHGFLLVWADNETVQNGTGLEGDLHANFKLNSGGEGIALFAPNGTPQHVVAFGPQIQNVSQGLFPDGNTNAVYAMTNWTPRAANQLGVPPSPEISGITMGADGTVTFSAPALADRAYNIEYKEHLTDPYWIPLATTRAVNGLVTFTDSTDGNVQRFYRVVLLP